MLYNGSRSGTAKSSYDMAYIRMDDSLTKIVKYNTEIRKSFASLSLSYDAFNLAVVDYAESLTVSFSHAMIKVIFPFFPFFRGKKSNLQQMINYCVTMLEITPYAQLVALSKDVTDPQFVENVAATNYVTSSILSPMRIYQDKYSNILRDTIFSLSESGERTLYILIGSCIAVVFVSIGLTLPVFIWVIKDKSYVIAIFADITDPEIRRIIDSAAHFDIRGVKYKNRWILDHVGDEDKFWTKILHDQSKRREVEKSPTKNDNPGGLNDGTSKDMKSLALSVMGSEKPIVAPMIKEEAEAKHEENEEEEGKNQQEEEGSEKPERIGLEKVPEDMEKYRKTQAKRKVLSQLDTKLRNTAILRLVIVLLVFLVYGGASLYFNYFIHDFNRGTIKHLYTLLKRSVYVPKITMMLRTAVMATNPKYVQPNKDGDGVSYGYEVIQKMQATEADIKEYEKIGNQNIFKKYFQTIHQFDTDQFCPLVDAMPVPQPEPCSAYYLGPKSQGMAGGFALLISFAESFSMKILSSDLKNDTQLAVLKSNPIFANLSFLINQYVFPAMDTVTDIYLTEADSFFDLIKQLAVTKAVCFGVIFGFVYFFVFIYFLETLKMEIWQTHGIINMIPDTLLEKNKAVQEQVWKRRGIK